MEASEALGGDIAAEESAAPAVDAAPAAPAEQAAPQAPDLTQEEEALAAKLIGRMADPIASTVVERMGQQGQTEPDAADGDFFDSFEGFFDDPAEADPAQQGQQPQAPADQGMPGQGQIDPNDPLLQSPVGQALMQQNQALEQALQQQAQQGERIIDYLAGKEAQQDRETINNFASEHPDIRQPEVLTGVRSEIDGMIAERPGDPSEHAITPRMVETAYYATLAKRAAAARAAGGEAQPQGASIETNAGAAVGSGAATTESPLGAMIRESSGGPLG